MAYISEHHRKHVSEGNNIKNGRVYFLVSWNAIKIDHNLKRLQNRVFID